MKWTEEEIKRLTALYPVSTPSELVNAFGRSDKAVRAKAKILGLRKNEIGRKRTGGVWSEEEKNTLARLYPHNKIKDLVPILGRSRSSIIAMSCKLKLYKTSEFRKEVAKETSFKKGHIPYNFRRKGIHHSPSTEFKKGHTPHNTKYNGCLTIRRNTYRQKDYLYTRVAKSRWKQFHQVVWEKYNGSIPKGYIVVFRNGDTFDCRLQNLELISRAECAQRNRNSGKAAETIKISRKYAAGRLAFNDPHLRELLAKHPDLLDLKNIQLELRRSINEARNRSKSSSAA